MSDPEIRLNLYARLARLRDLAAIDDFAEEIEDRFGPPPDAVRNLLDPARIRVMARRAGAVRVDAGPRGIAVTFDPAASARRASQGGRRRDRRVPLEGRKARIGSAGQSTAASMR